jgi:glycosyltransferase involved in cell wall biosynthesis
VDVTQFERGDGAAARVRFHVSPGPLVVYTGTLDRFQRIDYLLTAMRVVVDEGKDARLLIATNLATDADVRWCRSLVGQLDLAERVIIANVPFDLIRDVLAAADVTVAPRPNCPGVPVKLLNYMAAAKPIVVFEGSAKGLQHMQHALLVPDHDWRGLGHAILRLLGDRALAEELGRNAKRWAEENLSWPVLAARTEQVYEELLSNDPLASARLRR